MGRQDTDVSRQCFTRRLTVGIAKGVPTVRYGHKKPTVKSVGLLWVYPGGPSAHYGNGSGFRPIAFCLILIG